MNSMIMTPARLSVLKQAYEKALANGDEQFVCFNHTWLTAYARHLVKHLETNFNNTPPDDENQRYTSKQELVSVTAKGG